MKEIFEKFKSKFDFFERKPGRPTNETLKKRKIFYGCIIGGIAVITLSTVVLITNNINTKKLKGETTSASGRFSLSTFSEVDEYYYNLAAPSDYNWKYCINSKDSSNGSYGGANCVENNGKNELLVKLEKTSKITYYMISLFVYDANGTPNKSINNWKPEGWKVNTTSNYAYSEFIIDPALGNVNISLDEEMHNGKTTVNRTSNLSLFKRFINWICNLIGIQKPYKTEETINKELKIVSVSEGGTKGKGTYSAEFKLKNTYDNSAYYRIIKYNSLDKNPNNIDNGSCVSFKGDSVTAKTTLNLDGNNDGAVAILKVFTSEQNCKAELGNYVDPHLKSNEVTYKYKNATTTTTKVVSPEITLEKLGGLSLNKEKIDGVETYTTDKTGKVYLTYNAKNVNTTNTYYRKLVIYDAFDGGTPINGQNCRPYNFNSYTANDDFDLDSKQSRIRTEFGIYTDDKCTIQAQDTSILTHYFAYKGTTTTTTKTTTKSTQSSNLCDDNTIYKGTKYSLTDDQIRELARMAYSEFSNGIVGQKMVLSQMANLYEYKKKINSCVSGKTFYEYITRTDSCGWYGTASSAKDTSIKVSTELFNAAKDILVNGNRYLPLYIEEFDWFPNQIKNPLSNIDSYKRGITAVENTSNAKGTFWCMSKSAYDANLFYYSSDSYNRCMKDENCKNASTGESSTQTQTQTQKPSDSSKVNINISDIYTDEGVTVDYKDTDSNGLIQYTVAGQYKVKLEYNITDENNKPKNVYYRRFVYYKTDVSGTIKNIFTYSDTGLNGCKNPGSHVYTDANITSNGDTSQKYFVLRTYNNYADCADDVNANKSHDKEHIIKISYINPNTSIPTSKPDVNKDASYAEINGVTNKSIVTIDGFLDDGKSTAKFNVITPFVKQDARNVYAMSSTYGAQVYQECKARAKEYGNYLVEDYLDVTDYNPKVRTCTVDGNYNSSGTKAALNKAIYDNINKGLPVIVHVSTGGEHWVLVVGYRADKNPSEWSWKDYYAVDPFVTNPYYDKNTMPIESRGLYGQMTFENKSNGITKPLTIFAGPLNKNQSAGVRQFNVDTATQDVSVVIGYYEDYTYTPWTCK